MPGLPGSISRFLNNQRFKAGNHEFGAGKNNLLDFRVMRETYTN